MDMGEQGLDARDQRLAIEQGADRDGLSRGRPASPCRQACWHRSALQLAVAEMQPAKVPPRASSKAGLGGRNTSKPDAIFAASRA